MDGTAVAIEADQATIDQCHITRSIIVAGNSASCFAVVDQTARQGISEDTMMDEMETIQR